MPAFAAVGFFDQVAFTVGVAVATVSVPVAEVAAWLSLPAYDAVSV